MARVLNKAWHDSFFDCVSRHTDAPDNFIRWSAISLIGAALKNNVYFKLGTYTVYPNQFIVLVAPPGVGKGTAMNIAMDLADAIKPNPVVNTLTDRITAEKIIECIADGWAMPPKIVNQQLQIGQKDHTCWLLAEEIRVLLSASEWMLTMLEVAWSQKKFAYQTKNKGSVFIDDMCCSLLGASVPDFLRNANREARMIISGGFTSRCIFIYAENPSKDLPFPEPLFNNKTSKALYDKLVLDLKEISNLNGEFRVDPAARILFEQFLVKNRVATADDNSEAIVNFRARIKAHIIKLAMVFSVAGGDSLVITNIDMINAITEVNKVIGNLEKLFRGAGDAPDATATARIQDFIEKRGRTTKKEIMSNLHRHIGSSENFDRLIYVLVMIGFCTETVQNHQTVYQHVKSNTTNGKVPHP